MRCLMLALAATTLLGRFDSARGEPAPSPDERRDILLGCTFGLGYAHLFDEVTSYAEGAGLTMDYVFGIGMGATALLFQITWDTILSDPPADATIFGIGFRHYFAPSNLSIGAIIGMGQACVGDDYDESCSDFGFTFQFNFGWEFPLGDNRQLGPVLQLTAVDLPGTETRFGALSVLLSGTWF